MKRVANILWYSALASLVTVLFFLGKSEAHPTSDNPELIANCIAEQTHTHPMDDRFRELTNAVRLCRLEQKQ